VSVAARDTTLEKKYGRQQKNRPMSAPSTNTESNKARLSAGETYEYIKSVEENRPQTAKPRIYQQIKQEIAEGTLVIEEPKMPNDITEFFLKN
jgi:anti-sigma28 factor (negative regulator of flagellin synthesis)